MKKFIVKVFYFSLGNLFFINIETSKPTPIITSTMFHISLPSAILKNG